jgi:hypothetical protein
MPAWLIPAIMGASKLFSGAAQGSAQQRQAENAQAAQQNSLIAQLHGQRQAATSNALNNQSSEQISHANVDLNRRQHALAAPSARASQSVRGSILANAKPMTLSGLPDRVASRIPQISGGLTPEMFSADTRALGEELTRTALLDQLKGDNFDPLQKTDFASGVLAPPQLEQYEKSGLLEKIMAGLGLAGSVVGGVGQAIQGSRGNRRNENDPYAYRTPPYAGDEEDM